MVTPSSSIVDFDGFDSFIFRSSLFSAVSASGLRASRQKLEKISRRRAFVNREGVGGNEKSIRDRTQLTLGYICPILI
jgi:hypothetical protein